jgi:hypothetical protein
MIQAMLKITMLSTYAILTLNITERGNMNSRKALVFIALLVTFAVSFGSQVMAVEHQNSDLYLGQTLSSTGYATLGFLAGSTVSVFSVWSLYPDLMELRVNNPKELAKFKTLGNMMLAAMGIGTAAGAALGVTLALEDQGKPSNFIGSFTAALAFEIGTYLAVNKGSFMREPTVYGDNAVGIEVNSMGIVFEPNEFFGIFALTVIGAIFGANSF